MASPSQVTVDETTVKINGEWSWLYAAIDLETKLILDVVLFDLHDPGPAAAFLQKLREKHDLSGLSFSSINVAIGLPSRVGLSSRVNYTDRNLIEK